MLAAGVGVVAEIPDDLEHALLPGGGVEGWKFGCAKEPAGGQAQHGVIFRLGPDEIAIFGPFLQDAILAEQRANPKPGKNHVHGQVVHPLGADQRPRGTTARGLKRPMR